MEAFAKIEPDKAELVKLLYFVLLSEADAADAGIFARHRVSIYARA